MKEEDVVSSTSGVEGSIVAYSFSLGQLSGISLRSTGDRLAIRESMRFRFIGAIEKYLPMENARTGFAEALLAHGVPIFCFVNISSRLRFCHCGSSATLMPWLKVIKVGAPSPVENPLLR